MMKDVSTKNSHTGDAGARRGGGRDQGSEKQGQYSGKAGSSKKLRQLTPCNEKGSRGQGVNGSTWLMC